MEAFFQDQIRKMRLRYWRPKKNSEDEKRLRLDFAMPLTGQSLVSMPPEIRTALGVVGEVSNSIPNLALESTPNPQTIDIYATDKSSERMLLIVAADLRDFVVRRPSSDKGDDRQVELYFTITVPSDEQLLLWCDKYCGKVFWASFETTQASLIGEKKEAKSPATATSKRGRASGKDASAGERVEQEELVTQ